MTARIYLDHAASTPVSRAARAAMQRARSAYGNPSSIHERGRQAVAILGDARAKVARILGTPPEHVVFTSSGSEADALALLGAARAYRSRGTHLVVSSIEHKAVLKAAQALACDGFSVTYLRPDSEGLIDPKRVKDALRQDTILVSVMYANNEIGTVEPVREIADVIRAYRGNAEVPLFHTDACQATGQLPLKVEDLGVDLMTINSSKAYGPKGIGALYVERGVRLEPIVYGEQEEERRGGTESVELAAGFARALEEAEERREREAVRLTKLRDELFAEIESHIPDATVNGHRQKRLPNNVHVSFLGIEGESILLLLDAAGIECATGSACNSFDLAPSHVLLAIGNEASAAHGSIRFSLGRSTTRAHVRETAVHLERIVALLRGMSALTVPSAV